MKIFLMLFSTVLVVSYSKAQIVSEAPSARNPERLKVIGLSENDGATYAYTYSEAKENGRTVYSKGNLVFSLGTNYLNGNITGYDYSIYSKKGERLATHAISQNIYLRLKSILTQALRLTRYEDRFTDGECFIEIEVDRSEMRLSKVSPVCDDLK